MNVTFAGLWLERLIYSGLLLLIFLLPIPLGSNRPWALAGIELMLVGLWSLWLCGYLTGQIRLPRWHWSLILCAMLWACWIAWIALQIIPLPPEVVQQLSPHAYAVYHQLDNLGTNEQTTFRISVTVFETRQHLFESIAYAALFWLIVFLLSSSHRRLIGLLATLACAGFAQSVYGGFMVLSGLEYGFLDVKEYYKGSATGTFINRNHFAGYLEICIASGFGLLIASQTVRRGKGASFSINALIDMVLSPRPLIFLGTMFMLSGLLLSQSRMGNLAFFIALFMAGSLYLSTNLRRHFLVSAIVVLLVTAVVIWLLGTPFLSAGLLERLALTDLREELRLMMLPDLIAMWEHWALTGSGLGSFYAVYPLYQSETVTGFNQHAHNDYLQLLIETGVPGVVLLGGMVLLTALRGWKILHRRRNAVPRGIAFAALLAMLSIAIHSLADFNLQIPANAASLVALMAMVWCCHTHRAQRRNNHE